MLKLLADLEFLSGDGVLGGDDVSLGEKVSKVGDEEVVFVTVNIPS